MSLKYSLNAFKHIDGEKNMFEIELKCQYQF